MTDQESSAAYKPEPRLSRMQRQAIRLATVRLSYSQRECGHSRHTRGCPFCSDVQAYRKLVAAFRHALGVVEVAARWLSPRTWSAGARNRFGRPKRSWKYSRVTG